MSSNNSLVRNRTETFVRDNFARIFLLKLARLAVGFLPLAGLVSPAMKAGYTHGMVELVRGNDVKVGVIFSRFRQFLASMLLPIWTLLLRMVWVLPGLLITMVGLTLAAGSDVGMLSTITGVMFVGFSHSGILAAIGGIIALVGVILSFVCSIRAYFSYRMAHIAFADNPELDVYNAVEYSKSMMHGRKFHLFCLTLPYLAYRVLIVGAAIALGFIASELLADLFGVLLALCFVTVVAAIIGFIWLSLLEESALICFYEENRD